MSPADPHAPSPERKPSEGLATRAAALAVAEAALKQRGGLEAALERPPYAELDARDRALARMLAMTLLRRLGGVDQLLGARLKSPPPERVLMLLRLGVVQALFMEAPDYAAVDTVMRLAQADPATRPFKGLINAVLRGLLRERASLHIDPEAYAPAWLFARWRAAFGAEAARAVAAMIVEEPAVDLTPRDPADGPALAEALDGERLASGSLRVRRGGDLATWPGYDEGRWWVQDAAAAIPARLLEVRAGQTALDLCAAPGGKALQLAAGGARVTALDRAAPRLRRLSRGLERTGLAAEVIAADAARWEDHRRFDAVLLDAPCSATGTFRRHPEVLRLVKPGDIAKLAQVQAGLLDVAAGKVAPGGRLVYCVCALEPEEGEAQAAGFLARHPDFVLEPVLAGEGGAPAASITAEGCLRLLPPHMPGGCDGFFAARFQRA